MIMSIVILEEALCIKSLSNNKLSEALSELLYESIIIISCFLLSVEWNCSGIVKNHIYLFLKTLLCENFINTIAEVSPSDLIASASSKMFTKQIELFST